MRTRIRFLERGLAALLAAAVGMVGGVPLARAAAPGGDGAQKLHIAEDMQEDGQRRYDQADYFGAARTWARILDILTENEVNRQERDNTLLIALDAYSRPYYEAYAGQATRTPPPDIVQALADGVQLFDAYVAAYQRAYGETAVISPSAEEAGRQIKAYYAEAGGVAAKPEEQAATVVVGPPDPLCDPRVDRCGRITYRNGIPLIVMGSVAIVAGLASTSMIIVGSIRANDARAETPSRTDRSANGLIIGGSILTGVLVAGGATMLGIGIRRRVRYVAVAPAFGPRFTGLSLQGRF